MKKIPYKVSQRLNIMISSSWSVVPLPLRRQVGYGVKMWLPIQKETVHCSHYSFCASSTPRLPPWQQRRLHLRLLSVQLRTIIRDIFSDMSVFRLQTQNNIINAPFSAIRGTCRRQLPLRTAIVTQWCQMSFVSRQDWGLPGKCTYQWNMFCQ